MPVKGAYSLVPLINNLMDPASELGRLFDVVVITQDWHPKVRAAHWVRSSM